MKDVEALKKENEELRQKNANLDQSLKRLNAAHVALKQGHDFFVNDGQEIRTILVLEQQRSGELEKELEKIRKAVLAHEDVNKRLTEELNKMKEANKPVSIPDNVPAEQAA